MDNIVKILIFMTVLMSGGIGEAYRILLLIPIPTGSHAILGDALAKTLLEAGYEVVYVTGQPNRLQPHPKYVEVDVSSNIKYFPNHMMNLTNFLDNPENPPNIVEFLDRSTVFSIQTVKHEAVQRILNDGKKFDLVVAEWMFTEMYAGLPALLDCPLIWFSTMEPHSMILNLIDEGPNPAYNADLGPNHVVPFTFFQRVQVLGMRIFLTVYRGLSVYFKETNYFIDIYGPMMKKLGKSLPSYEELRFNASLILSNSHVTLGQPTCLPQNFVPIGGFHIDPQPKPLSQDLKKIMDDAKNGVVYFSMGSIMNSKDFPNKLKMDLLNMLGSLKQTVLWKFEENFPNLPSNVRVLKWASQQSILNHPNCMLFITHGGLLSLTEAVHYGVPIIGVPGFADQFINIMRAEQKGFAKKVDLSYNLAIDLKEAIEEVHNNPQYKENIKTLSFVYHHRPVDPRKAIVHWVDHVIQTRGAPWLRSPALNVPFYQKFYLDLALLILVIFLILRLVVKRTISMFSIIKLQNTNDLQTKKVK